MRFIIFCLLLFSASHSYGQALQTVSNTDNDLKKHTEVLASRLLSWSTGNKEQIGYVSVGRYANYFGFVKMRVSSKHSLSRSEVGKAAMSILTDDQHQLLYRLLRKQTPLKESTHRLRLRANDFLMGYLNGVHDDTEGQTFIDLATHYAVKEAELGELLARDFSKLIQSLSGQQLELLVEVRQQSISGNFSKSQFQPARLKTLSKQQKQEVLNLAARLLSWTTGDLEDNAYETIGKPSQHFGFVSMRIESNHGVKRGVLANEVMSELTQEQLASLGTAAEHNKQNLANYLVARNNFLKSLMDIRATTTPLPEFSKRLTQHMLPYALIMDCERSGV